MRDHKVFLKLLLLDTETHPPPSAVVAVNITCEPVKPRLLQTGLFIPLAPEPEKLELTLARLGKLLGAENIGSPELLDTHRPDAFRVQRFVLKQTKSKRGKSRTVNSKQQTANSRQQRAENPRSEIAIRNRYWVFGFFGRRCGRWCRPREVIQQRLVPGTKPEVFMEKLLGWLVHGARPAIGGVRMVGPEMNGTWRWNPSLR